MFKKSTKEQLYTYKAKKVFRSRPDEQPFTIISLYEKRKDGSFLYGELTTWQNLNVEDGDLIAFFDISAMDIVEKDKGYAVYNTIKFISTQVKVFKEK